MAAMKEIYSFLGRHLHLIKKIFLLTYILVVVGIVVGVMFYSIIPEARELYGTIGRKAGQISTILLLLSMTPGILTRLGVLKMVESILLLFRRQFGVTAFFTAILHLMYMSWIRRIAAGQNPLPSFFTYQQYGFAALSIFILLWFTSNDFSMRLLGPLWKLIQRLAYIAAIVLMIHIFVSGSQWWIPIGIYLGFEAISWVIQLLRWSWPKQNPPVNRRVRAGARA